MEFRDLKKQYAELEASLSEVALSVLASGAYIGGKEVAALEQELASYVGVEQCVSCANGTDALQLALLAWGVGPGDAVFVPDFTFFSSGEVVSTVGATPVFVDVEQSTFNIDPASLAASVESVANAGQLKPAVVVAVDLFGLPANYPEIRRICDAYGMLLLEDGAQGFGGQIGDQKACSFGDISTTSFFPAKPLGCYGDGGAVFTDNQEWAALMKSYAVHGKGTMKYDNVRVGMNSRLDAIQAAILREKLKVFERSELERVNAVAQHYSERLSASNLLIPQIPEGYFSSWAQYSILFPEDGIRDAAQSELKQQGIPTMVYYPKAMHEQQAFSGKHVCIDGCPVATQLTKRVLSLPMGPYMTRDDVDLVCDSLLRVCAE